MRPTAARVGALHLWISASIFSHRHTSRAPPRRRRPARRAPSPSSAS